MRTFITFSVFFIFLLVTGCRKEENDPEISNSLSSVSPSVFLATADIHERGVYEITDHGFVVTFSTERPTYANGETISLGNIIEHDTFCSIIDINKYQISYYDNLKCYVRAYITNKKGTVYSDFAWKPVPLVQVNSIYPSFAHCGDTVLIRGINLDSDITKNIVKFNNINATVIAANTNQLNVIVPENIPFDYWDPNIDIQINSAGRQFNLYDAFQILPTVTGFSPSSGSWNTLITITGSGLQSSYALINDQIINNYSLSPTSLTIRVPEYISEKKFKIALSFGSSGTRLPVGDFTMEQMVIEPLTTLNYHPGSTINITGTGFHPYSHYNKMIIGNYSTDASYGSTESISFTLPGTIDIGSYTVGIANSIDTLNLDEPINIVKPIITGISADSAYAGSMITLTGTNLLKTGDDYPYPYVYFGDNAISQSSGDNTQLKLQVPFVNPGTYIIKAAYSGFDVYYDGYFIVIEPKVKSINPSTGWADMSVIINGEGFSDVASTSVYFGNIQAQILSMSSTQINAKVPSQVSTGSWLIQVYVNGFRVKSNVTFTVQ